LNDNGCYKEAADLLIAYSEGHQKSLPGCDWHIAQMLGFHGDYPSAIKYALRNIFLTDEVPFAKWHSYILGTVAFWNKDLVQLKRCIAVLKDLAKLV